MPCERVGWRSSVSRSCWSYCDRKGPASRPLLPGGGRCVQQQQKIVDSVFDLCSC